MHQNYDGLHRGAVVHASERPARSAPPPPDRRRSRAERWRPSLGVVVASGLRLTSRSGFRFFRAATAGGFGATAAAARLLGLDRDALERAFAWRLAQASGTMQAHVEGSPILPAQVAFNARAGLQSCTLATLPFTAAEAVFEGDYGYLRLFEGEFALEPVLASLGRDWRITEFSHKPFPAGRATHGGIEGASALQQEHGFAASEVAAVEIAAPPLIVRLVGRPPRSGMGASYARLCMAYAVAKVLLNGKLDLADFRGSALADPATHDSRAASRSRTTAADPNALSPQRVVVRPTTARSTAGCEAMLARPPVDAGSISQSSAAARPRGIPCAGRRPGWSRRSTA